MIILNLYLSQEIIISHNLIPELKIIKKGFKCNFPGYESCITSEYNIWMHYYIYQKYISKNFKDWESIILQIFFDNYHKKYNKLFIPQLIIDILQ